MTKRRRRSRAKRLTNADLARIDNDLANVPEQDFDSWAEALRRGRAGELKGNPYAQWVRPSVDREALLRAVNYSQFNFVLNLEAGRDTIDLDKEGRWRRLCLIRAAKRELAAMERELGEVIPAARADDPRNRTPVTKETLWRLSHPGEEPRNTAEVSRWYARDVLPFVEPSIDDPACRKRVTINLRLFAERFALPLEALRVALP